MVAYRESPADGLFHALADATRREIVALTLTREHSVSELARRFPMSFAAVQKHVAVLERSGLVVKQRHGREQRVRGNATALVQARQALDQLETLWRGRIDRIDAILDEPDPPAGAATRPIVPPPRKEQPDADH